MIKIFSNFMSCQSRSTWFITKIATQIVHLQQWSFVCVQQRGSDKLELVCADRLSESEGNKFHPAKFFLNGARGYSQMLWEFWLWSFSSKTHICFTLWCVFAHFISCFQGMQQAQAWWQSGFLTARRPWVRSLNQMIGQSVGFLLMLWFPLLPLMLSQ